ncbi:hypothetical protein LSTR_LSTR012458 [Laodelphax striatellus]|uniref:RING-type domain-containing protein n=1 Tax=Laodelphax striatellus TaxID=195883 RepID=A0A482XT51_LAOST|nr:hypothetical protein LSTR_LSTR012458 [Laodelphax striatellus]
MIETIWNLLCVSTWIVTNCLKTVYCAIALSVWTGEKIVSIAKYVLTNFTNALAAILSALSILYNDFQYFAGDIAGLFSIANNLSLGTLQSICDIVISVMNFSLSIINSFTGAISICKQQLLNFIHLLKDSLILIGNTALICIQFIPVVIFYLISLGVMGFSRSTQEIWSIINHFLSTPIEAVFGLAICCTISWVIHKNWSVIVRKILKAYHNSLGYSKHVMNYTLATSKSILITNMTRIISYLIELRKTRLNKKRTGKSHGKHCVVCLDDEANVIIIPCRHLCLCYSCSMKTSTHANFTCPICRKVIGNYMRVFT